MKKLILLICFGVICSIAACPPIDNIHKEKYIHEGKKHLFILWVQEEPFSPELLREAIFYENIESPEIVFIQARLETGQFTSDIFINGNNIFGMRLARVRETTATGEYRYHARYDNWYDSVRDYRLFQIWYASKSYDLTNYTLFLRDMGYATDKRYVDKINEMS